MYVRQDELQAEARKTLYQHGYEHLVPIGDGGFATIYQVTSRQYQEDFVVKLIDLNHDDKSALPASFQAEIAALTNLYHPNVIKIFDHFTSDTLLYIILEYCPGGSLKDVMTNAGGMIKPPIIYELCHQIISALNFCHERGVAHRDVKPSNILIDKYGRAKLADFGLAQHFGNNRKSQLIRIFGGSLPYLAPEILQQKPYDPMKADVWALGVTFYEMASGNLPWDAQSPEQLLKMIKSDTFTNMPEHFHPNFSAVLKLMLEPHPSRRCKLTDLLQLSIFCPKATVAQAAGRSLSRDNALAPKQRMKPIASTILTVKSATTRKSCLYAKKRNVQIEHPTFDPTFECD